VGVHGEPTMLASVRGGVDVVTFSGDKLLGGPQAGLISGSRELVAKIRSNPLFRAVRVDKMFYAALEATLLAYLREDYDSIPVLRMIRLTDDELRSRAEHFMRKLHITSPQLHIEVVASRSVLGGGAAPGSTLATHVLAISSAKMKADAIAESLRSSQTPIIARVEDGRVLIDLRTVTTEEETVVAQALETLAS
jgi:L-seryl-tRNA(Ser) seleniumtransferase